MSNATMPAYPNTLKIVNQSRAPNLNSWKQKFVSSLVNIGKINVSMGSQGEIHDTCMHTKN